MPEDLVKVGLDVRTHTLGLQKIVVERTAPRSVSFIVRRDECAGWHSLGGQGIRP